MRLFFVLILGGIIGWLIGSVYPAPQAWLAQINVPALQQRLNPATATPAAPMSTPTPAPGAQQPAAASSTPTPTPSSHRGPVDEQTLNQYRAWIHEARQAHPYSDSEARMYALMMCESRGQATLVNPAGPYSGLFQYSSATWRGAWNTYRDQSILDPRAQIFATALAFQRHMQGQWGC